MGKLLLVFCCIVAICVSGVSVHGENENAAAPPPDDSCTNYLFTLIDCVEYITNGSTDLKPTPGCCTALKPVLDDHHLCLCEILTANNSFGIPINVTRAISLPPACGFSPFNVCDCSGAVVPPPPPPPPSPAPGPSPPPSPPSPAPSPAPAPTPPTPSPAPTPVPVPPTPSPPVTPAPAMPPSGASVGGSFSISFVVALFSLALATVS